MKGKVYILGAGPGDIGLLTLRAKELIETADVIIYDRLINDRILDFAKPDCEKIDAGKESGRHKIKQNKIEEILAKQALKRKIVVRLKGGDPYLFGRGSEEALYLHGKKIDFEVIPGITSAIAGPSYAGIPVTHRDFAYSATFITGHRADDKDPLSLDWDNLAKNKGTLVFLMGVKNLPFICKNLIAYGKNKNTPAAVVSWATFPVQKKVVGTISNITEKAKKEKLSSPGIIIIGDVVVFSDKLDWFSKKHFPLRGKTILVPRAKEKQSALRAYLENLGARTISFPVIKHVALKNKNSAKFLKNMRDYDYLIFTSPSTIEFLIKELRSLNMDIRCLYGPEICVIGPGTLKSLQEYHLNVSIIPKKFIAEGLIEILVNKNIKNKKILIVRSENARPALPEGLEKLGANVDVLNIYKTVADKPEKTIIKETASLIKDKHIDLIVFMSGTQVKNFKIILNTVGACHPSTRLRRAQDKSSGQVGMPIQNIPCACIGPETEKEARLQGFNVALTSKEYSFTGLVKAIEGYYKRRV